MQATLNFKLHVQGWNLLSINQAVNIYKIIQDMQENL